MTLRVVLSVAEVALLVLVLAFFLIRIRRLLGGIVANLERIADGVDAVRGHCSLVGPGVAEVNAMVAEAAGYLDEAARSAEGLGSSGAG